MHVSIIIQLSIQLVPMAGTLVAMMTGQKVTLYGQIPATQDPLTTQTGMLVNLTMWAMFKTVY